MESGWCYVQTIQKLEREMVELRAENERLKKDLLQLKLLRELHLKMLKDVVKNEVNDENLDENDATNANLESNLNVNYIKINI